VVDLVEKALCALTGHSPNRHRAWHDGLDWRAPCNRCDVALIRDNAGWRLFTPDDHSIDRAARPLPHSHRAGPH
jgi:hypothetical protein